MQLWSRFGPARGVILLVLGVLAPRAGATPLRVACIGEHTVHSDKLQRSQEWPRMMGDKLGPGYDVQNFGDCCATVLLEYPPQHANHPYIKPYDRPAYKPGFHESVAFMPDVVIIGPWGKHEWEMADILYNGVLPPDRFLADYETLVKTYLDLPGKPKVFVSLPIPFPMGTAKVGLVDTILAATQTIASKYQLPIIDLYHPFLGHPELYKDITHIADGPGQRKIAEVVQAALSAPAPDAGAAATDAEAIPADAGAAVAMPEVGPAAPEDAAPSPDARSSPGPEPDAAIASPAAHRSGCSQGGGGDGAALAWPVTLALLAISRSWKRRPRRRWRQIAV
jgi:acyl-CoA thioesterase-1